MIKTKIRGFVVEMDDDHLKIENSYVVKSKKQMEIILDKIFTKDELNRVKRKRTIDSLVAQWSCVNKLYKLNLFKKKNKNCVFKPQVNKLQKLLYRIIGGTYKTEKGQM